MCECCASHVCVCLTCRGWANVGFHQPTPNREVQTPNIDAIANGGMVLNRGTWHHANSDVLFRLSVHSQHVCAAYAYRFCSPSRSSLNSGRLPVHVNTQNAKPDVHNPKDPVSGFAGIPRNMTGLGSVLRKGGYHTHQVQP